MGHIQLSGRLDGAEINLETLKNGKSSLDFIPTLSESSSDKKEADKSDASIDSGWKIRIEDFKLCNIDVHNITQGDVTEIHVKTA